MSIKNQGKIGRLVVKQIVLVLFMLSSFPAFAADYLDCMNKPMGEPEQATLNQNTFNRQDDKIAREAQAVIEDRARVCAYLHGWSVSATHLAVQYRWSQLMFMGAPGRFFDKDQQDRLDSALQPIRSRLAAKLASSADAVARGEDPPPPPLGASMFPEFHMLLKAANIPQTRANVDLLEGWLYKLAFDAAIVAAFSSK